MAHHPLYHSATFWSVVHALMLARKRVPPPLFVTVTGACVTSIWNHGGNSRAVMWLDRAWMCFSVAVHTLHPAVKAKARLLMYASVLSFFIAKWRYDYRFHLAAHALMSASNVLTLW